MAAGIPVELITMLGSGALSGVMTLWSKHLENKKSQWDALLALRGQEANAIDKARQTTNPGFAFTRRLIALSAVFSIIVLPKVAAVMWPDLPVLVGYTEWVPGFWFLVDGVDAIKWMTFKGLVITPLDTHLMSAIVGLYFGASVVKNAR